jgi:hypothetical protein
MHHEMLQCAQDFHEALGIAYRVVNIVSGELNDAAMIKYDLEGWFPGQGQYRELVSCSNCTDFQSRALDVRCRMHRVDHENKSTVHQTHVHMLNSTLTATGRGICCILETYQTSDGVHVPEVLVPHMGGTTFIPFVRGPREVDACGAPLKQVEVHAKPMTTPSTANVGARLLLPPQDTTVLADGTVNLEVLDAKLLEKPYVNGFTPSQLDVAVFGALRGAQVDPAKFPNAARWLQHIASFTPMQRHSWG